MGIATPAVATVVLLVVPVLPRKSVMVLYNNNDVKENTTVTVTPLQQ
jgi:hypothetical protein